MGKSTSSCSIENNHNNFSEHVNDYEGNVEPENSKYCTQLTNIYIAIIKDYEKVLLLSMFITYVFAVIICRIIMVN